MIVYRLEDRIPIKVGDFTVKVSPLSEGQYSSVMNKKTMSKGEEVADAAGMALATLKYCVKELESVTPIKFSDGSKFKLKHDDNGELSENSVAALIQILGAANLTNVANMIISSNLEGATIKEKPLKSKKKR